MKHELDAEERLGRIVPANKVYRFALEHANKKLWGGYKNEEIKMRRYDFWYVITCYECEDTAIIHVPEGKERRENILKKRGLKIRTHNPNFAVYHDLAGVIARSHGWSVKASGDHGNRWVCPTCKKIRRRYA